tara:strand:+ start:41567 stop:50893 length:9327 start_codon:yes stop_codon:yes gene_type:complete
VTSLSVRESIDALQLRAFVDDLDRKWSWWSNKKDQLVAPVIPDNRGLVYLHNHAENYVVAVTPLGHDIVYVVEVDAPKRAISGTIEGKEVVLVLTDRGTIEVFSPTLEHQQTITLSDPATDVVWAEDLLWVVGNTRNHIDVFYVQQDPDGCLVFAPFRYVEGVADINHVMWLGYSRSIVAVSTTAVYFISFDEFTVEEVPLPFEVGHAYAHNSLVVFSARVTGEVYCLDLASSLLVDLYSVESETLNEDPIVVQRKGYYSTWHGNYVVTMVAISEPDGAEVSTVIQSIEKTNGAVNSEQPETVILFEEKADYFNLPSVSDCLVGEHYESQSFSLGHDGDPLLVVSDGSTLVVTDSEGTESSTQVAWVTDEELRLERQYNVMDGLHFRSRVEVYEPVDEVALHDDIHGEMKGTDFQYDSDGQKRLFLSDPVEASGFWVGSFESDVIKVESLRVIQSVEPSLYSVIPTGTSVLTEFRLQYRDQSSLTTKYTEYSNEPQQLPADGTLTGYQIRCYLSTSDLNKTPEIPSFAVDQVRHVRLTTGFWDNYKAKPQRVGISAPSTRASTNTNAMVGLYQTSHETNDNSARVMQSSSAHHANKHNYALGSTVTVRTMDASYKLLRSNVDLSVGNFKFEIQQTSIRNWANTAHAYLARQFTSRSGYSTKTGIHGTQAATADPFMRMMMLYSRSAQRQLLNSEGMQRGTSFSQDIDYSRALSNGETNRTIASRTYHNVMTYSDVQYFIGLNTLAGRLAYKTWTFTFVSRSIHEGANASYGAAYPSRKSMTQAALFTGDKRAISIADEDMRGIRYQVPFQAFDGLFVAGQYQRKEVLGYDQQYYTHARRHIAMGYDTVLASLHRSSDFQGDTKGTSSASSHGETVLEALRSAFTKTNRLGLSQVIKSWRVKAPLAGFDSTYATRSVWSGKDKIDRWLASYVESNRAFASTKLTMAELSHLTSKVGAPMSALQVTANRMRDAKHVNMTVTGRGMQYAEPMLAYPVQLYTFTAPDALGYAPTSALSLHASNHLVQLFKVSATKSHIADTLRYIVTNQNALQELKYAIRYALDRIMMEAPLSFNFNLVGSTTASMADAILANRGFPTSAAADPMNGRNAPRTSAPTDPLVPKPVGTSNDVVGINTRLDNGGNMPAAQKLVFSQAKGTSDVAELFYEVLSNWSIDSGVDKVRFTRALLSSDSAEDVSYLMSRLSTAGTDIINLVRDDQDVPAAELVKFLTAAYLTSSLPETVSYDARESNAFSSTIELLYNALARSSVADDDVTFTLNSQSGFISTVALRLFRDAAYKWQRAAFDVGTGNRVAQAQVVPFEMQSGSAWNYSDGLKIPSRVHRSTLAQAKGLGYVNHTIKKFATTIDLNKMGYLFSSEARLIPFGKHKASTKENTLQLHKVSGMSTRTDRLTFTVEKSRSGFMDAVPFAMGETKVSLNVVPLRLTEARSEAESVLEYYMAQTSINRFSTVPLRVQGFLGTSKSSTLVARGAKTGAELVKGQAFTLQPFTRVENKVDLRIIEVENYSLTASNFDVQRAGVPMFPQPVGMDVISGSTYYQDLVKLIRSQAISPKNTQTLDTALHASTTLMDSAQLAIDSGITRVLNGVDFETKSNTSTQINAVLIGRDAVSNIEAEAVAYNTNDWLKAVKSNLVDWAFSQLKAIPKGVFTKVDKNSRVLSDLVNFKLDKVGITIDELIKLVTADSISAHREELPFTKASWTNVQVGTQLVTSKLSSTQQDIYHRQGHDLNRKHVKAVTLTSEPSVRYWVDRIETSAVQRTSRLSSDASVVAGTDYASNLVETTVEYQTLRQAIEHGVASTVVMSQDTTADGLLYTRVAGGQTHYEDGLPLSTVKTTELQGSAKLTRGGHIRTELNNVSLASLTSYAAHLGERLLLVRDRQLTKEIGVNYQNQDALTILEQAVLLNRLAQRALQNKVTLSKESSMEIAGLQTTHMRLMDNFVEQLPEVANFNIAGSQIKAMNDVLMQSETSYNAIMNDVAMLVMEPHSLAMKHVESVVMRWAKYLADVTGTKLQINTMETAVELIKITMDNVPKIDTTSEVFGTTIRLADAHSKVMQPLINLHETMAVKEGYAENPVLTDVALEVLRGFNPKFAAVDLAKATDFHLAMAGAQMEKATTEHYKHMKIPSVTDALGRHMRVKTVKGYKPRDGKFMSTTYMSKFQPFALTMTKSDFHVSGSLQLINGRKALTRYVTQRIELTPWSQADSMRLKSIEMKVAKASLNLQEVKFDSLTGFRSTLSQKAEYWFPKFRHTFPYGLPNWLQDYGHISQSLGRSHIQSPYRASTDQIMGTQELELIKKKTDSLSLSQDILTKQVNPTTSTAVRMTGEQWVKPQQHAAPMMQGARYHQVMMPTAPSISIVGSAWVKMLDQIKGVGSSVLYKQSAMGQRIPVTVETDRWVIPTRTFVENYRLPKWTQRYDQHTLSRIIHSVQLEVSAVDVNRRYDQDVRTRPDVKITDVIRLRNAQAHDYVNKDFIRIESEYVNADVTYTKWSPFDVFSNAIHFEQLDNYSEVFSGTGYHQLSESRYATHTKFYQTLTSEMATKTDIKKRFTPHVRPTSTAYSLSLPVGVPLGHAANKAYVPIRDIVSTDFWIAMRRDGRGYSLLNDRPIGLRDKVSSSDIRITDMKRINPQNVSSIAKKIEIVLRKTITKLADSLDFERLAAPSESQLYQKWVANLTEVAIDHWDFKQQKVALSEKEHDEVVKVMRENWFGNQWYAQKPESMTEFYHAMRQALAETTDSYQSYKQSLESDSAIYNKLVQSDLVAPEIYNALLQAGLSVTQADMFFAQAKEVSKAHYMRLKQYQLGQGELFADVAQAGLGDTESYNKFDQSNLGDTALYDEYDQESVSAKRLDRLYEQYEQGLASLYSSLKAMGLSDARIDEAYAQATGAEAGGVLHSKYASYQDMVNAVGQAYEQYLLSDPVANMHYRMMKPMDTADYAKLVGNILPTFDIIDRYKQAAVAKSDDLFVEYAVDMATVLDSIDYSLMKPLPFHDRVDVNLPIKFRSEDFRRYKAGIVQIDLMQWLRDLRTKYREELIEKVQNGTARGTYSPRAAMIEAIRNGVVEPILYRDPDDGSWLYRRYTLGDTEYGYVIWGNLA